MEELPDRQVMVTTRCRIIDGFADARRRDFAEIFCAIR